MHKHKKKILLIEDDPAQVAMYKMRLELENFEVISIEKPDDSILVEVIKAKPDLILLDLVLYDIDGIKILKELRANNETKDMKVLILTNLVKANKLKDAQKLGALDVLIKAELTLDQLMAIIKGYLPSL